MKRSNRPVLDIPITRSEVICEVFSALMLLSIVGTIWFYYPQLPDTVVTHFALSGQADGVGSKVMYVVLLVVVVGLYAILSVTARIPHTFNYLQTITEENARSQYLLARKFVAILKLETVGLFFFVIWSAIQVTLDRTQHFDSMNVCTLTIMLFASICVYAYRSKKVA